ncbi:SURF1 family protein [Streptomyces sp. NRRL F-5126]|uniref:SURF1 family cytochrome oxidase biogenesis protein n=1 Tax=Streptomyces sp. NRRL F-5126 TaxID=1463857 RepID=UPI0004C97B24|nr:SURF1 family protein [Streptomyces sp. NRRL F-5126]
MLRTLLTRRWVILTLVFAALIPTFYRLGLWQYHRYEETKRNDALINGNLSAPTVAMTSLSKPGGTVPFSDLYRTVSATGHYDPAHQFVIRQRTDAHGDTIGFHLITPLITASGDAILVNRGWVKPANNSGTAYPPVPKTPKGTIKVVGRLRPDETYASTGIHRRVGLPPKQYMIINSREQAKNLPEPVVAGYMELKSTKPTPPASEEAELVPNPNADSDSMAVVGKGVHLPYAIQWWLFAAGVPVGWWVLFRRDVRDEREAAEAKAEAAGGDGPDGDGGRGAAAAAPTAAAGG